MTFSRLSLSLLCHQSENLESNEKRRKWWNFYHTKIWWRLIWYHGSFPQHSTLEIRVSESDSHSRIAVYCERQRRHCIAYVSHTHESEREQKKIVLGWWDLVEPQLWVVCIKLSTRLPELRVDKCEHGRWYEGARNAFKSSNAMSNKLESFASCSKSRKKRKANNGNWLSILFHVCRTVACSSHCMRCMDGYIDSNGVRWEEKRRREHKIDFGEDFFRFRRYYQWKLWYMCHETCSPAPLQYVEDYVFIDSAPLREMITRICCLSPLALHCPRQCVCVVW